MDVVMDVLGERNLLFLDSRTTAESVARLSAEREGVFFLQRDVFLDNEPTDEQVLARLEDGLEIARQAGRVVMIGHVQNPATYRALRRILSRLPDRGFYLSPLAAYSD
jgi:polysaccharide deacetylase 2 family uncharacterized protein YibQ